MPVSRINPLARELLTKVVYYGPGLSGKTTSLKHVHDTLPADRRGNFVSLATETDRTIFFDFLPVRISRVRNLTVRLALYTVPGQSFYAATRKLVLNGADGVVFVADSQPAARDSNLESLADLEGNLAAFGLSLQSFPHVFQFNKRDVPGVMSVEEMARDLNRFGAPVVETSATSGAGVMLALKTIIQGVIRALGGSSDDQAQKPPRTTKTPALGSGTGSAELQLAPSRPPAPASASSRGGLVSFGSLWPHDASISVVEHAIAAGNHALAVTTAAEMLAEILQDMPGVPDEEGAVARGILLGLDGREYLRLCKLASVPSETLTAQDALFALHLVVSARFKVLSV